MKKYILFLLLLVAINKQSILNITNKDRAANNLPKLKLNHKLSKAAQQRANDMAANHYFSHANVFEVIQQYIEKYTLAGENLGKGFASASSLNDALMASPSHKENILNPDYNQMGVGVKGDIVVELFIRS